MVDEWDASNEPGTAGFHEKCLMYSALLAIVPKRSLRTTIFREYLDFWRESPVERSSPPEWAWHLQGLLKEEYEEKDQAVFVRAVAESGDATMQAYADLLMLSEGRGKPGT